MWEEGRLKASAAGQHGLVTRANCLATGATDEEISRRIASGRAEVFHPGVYYIDSVPATWKTDVHAAVLAAGPDAVASHRCAAVLWELDAINARMVEVTVPYLASPEPVGVVLHRTRRINPSEIRDGIPVTSPEKTLLDIAPVVPMRTLVKAARSAVRTGLTSVARLDQSVGTSGGRGVTGTRALRTVIRYVADDQSGSVAEIDLKNLILDAPLPQPVQQLKVTLPDRTNAYPDFAWPDRMRIVEVDGFGAHGSPQQFRSDLQRQNLLMELGWELRRFTATDIRDDPERVRTEIVRFVNRPFCEG